MIGFFFSLAKKARFSFLLSKRIFSTLAPTTTLYSSAAFPIKGTNNTFICKQSRVIMGKDCNVFKYLNVSFV
ncbi:hypothetical protein K492DRAFT_34964 [Lichtheimia hyalospora FSU 10163]|nr:hypothetical protein K492DRAFT_34964 [Lichtheimia hyalospora FSU 10163]